MRRLTPVRLVALASLLTFAACEDTGSNEPVSGGATDDGSTEPAAVDGTVADETGNDTASDDPAAGDDSLIDDTPIDDGLIDDTPIDDEPIDDTPIDGEPIDDPNLAWEPCDGDDEDQIRPDGWERASHCKGEDPDYDRLFDDSKVQRVDITVSAANYQATMDDLEDILGSTVGGVGGGGPGGGGPGGGGPGGGGSGGGGPGGGASLDDGEDPMWVPVTISYGDETWDHVGMRYKGNSSLRSSWSQGTKKLSFRLSFDKFEDDHPEVDNQRFWGFKKMTFSNGFKDDSLMRDKLAADLFRDAGIPAARGAFYEVWVDFGQGPTFFGLYTMIEDPSDEMLDVQFGDGDGNLYKPEGNAATWVDGTWDTEHFEKKTNEDDSDWSDILAAWDALHGDRSDAPAWRAELEAVFDVDGFLRWLAMNQAIVNWDTYGVMNHNYYVYSDPSDDGRVTWFPWDLNEAMLVGGGGPGGGSAAGDVLCESIGTSWPMIRYLLDDATYMAQYQSEFEDLLDGALAMDRVTEKVEAYHDLVAPYAAQEASPYTFLTGNSFATSGQAIIDHIDGRHDAVAAALGQ